MTCLVPLVVSMGEPIAGHCTLCDRGNVTLHTGHADDCPMVTGFFAFDGSLNDVARCGNCAGPARVRCGRCQHEFEDDETYRLLDIRTQRLVVIPSSVGLALCMGCAEAQRARTFEALTA